MTCAGCDRKKQIRFSALAKIAGEQIVLAASLQQSRKSQQANDVNRAVGSFVTCSKEGF
jgi:hypothetical protein